MKMNKENKTDEEIAEEMLESIEEPVVFQTHNINLEVTELDQPITCQGFCDGGMTQYMVIIKGKYYCPSCALMELYGME
jgi:late competence protein required for DNA uptake (superfamily II DNA/RNA helicase)